MITPKAHSVDLDGVVRAAEQPVRGLPDHDAGEQEQQRGLGQRGNALDLAVAVVVLLVGGLAGNAHREIGHHGRDKVEQRMRGFRQDRERAGGEADRGFGERQAARCDDRGQRDALLDVLHGGLVAGTRTARRLRASMQRCAKSRFHQCSAFLMAIALPIRNLEMQDSRGRCGADCRCQGRGEDESWRVGPNGVH